MNGEQLGNIVRHKIKYYSVKKTRQFNQILIKTVKNINSAKYPTLFSF